MRKRHQLILGLSDERGATAIIIGTFMVVFISLAAMAIDVGYAMATRNELQNIADGAALAAARQLSDDYSGLSPEVLLNYVVDGAEEGFLKSVAKDVASKNQAGGVDNIILNDSDIEIGQWDTVSSTFTPTLEQPDAVRVIARREAGTNGPVKTFFAGIFGQNEVDVNAIATAALSGPSEIAACELIIPVGISAAWFDYNNETTGSFCNQNIKMYPTGNIEGCAGWHTFEDWPANASKLRKILNDKIDGDCSDGYKVGDELIYMGGTVASAFDEIEALFEWGRENDDDGNNATWTTHVVVYDDWDCSNPSGYIAIVGFATIVIDSISGPPKKEIGATVKCLDYIEGRAGGLEFGTKGAIPGLVQ